MSITIGTPPKKGQTREQLQARLEELEKEWDGLDRTTMGHLHKLSDEMIALESILTPEDEHDHIFSQAYFATPTAE